MQFLDLSQQKPRKYVMLLQGPSTVPAVGIYIDDYTSDESGVIAYVEEGSEKRPVAAFSGAMEWAVFDTALVMPVRRDAAIRDSHASQRALEALHDELDKDAAEIASMARVIERKQVEDAFKKVTKPEDDRKAPGVYI